MSKRKPNLQAVAYRLYRSAYRVYKKSDPEHYNLPRNWDDLTERNKLVCLAVARWQEWRQMSKAEAMREKRILHLTLYRHWFVQIMKGLKVEEYRRRTSYWVKRLIGRGYDEVHFRNGYAKDAPFMRVEFRGVKDGDPIAVQLGMVLEVRNELRLKGDTSEPEVLPFLGKHERPQL